MKRTIAPVIMAGRGGWPCLAFSSLDLNIDNTSIPKTYETPNRGNPMSVQKNLPLGSESSPQLVNDINENRKVIFKIGLFIRFLLIDKISTLRLEYNYKNEILL